MKINSKYNFHSHTYRCGHASSLPESCYLDNALYLGYKKYGITDHVPVHPIFYTDSSVRMHDSSVLEYLETINYLKGLYRDYMEVFLGFEAEYDEIIEEYLCDLRDKCDYMILGQHYVLNKNIRKTPEYPLEYAKKVCSAIESGIFDIVAHPDIFMQYRFNMNDEKRNLFNKNALIAARMICEKAKEYGVVLELNLGATFVTGNEEEVLFVGGSSLSELTKEEVANYLDSKARYPTRLFWDVVREVGNDVVVGIDAHFPEDIDFRDIVLDRIGKYIDLDGLNFLSDSYDPVSRRNDNLKIKVAYEKTKNNLTCVEGRIISSLFNELDGDSISKMNIIVNKLKEAPKKKLGVDDNYDDFTYKKRQELMSVIEDGVRKSSFCIENNDSFIKSLKDYIDGYYDTLKKENTINVKKN